MPIRTRRARRRDNRQRGRPSSISPRETSTQVAQVPRAHRAPSAQGERAPRIRPAPHTRKKTKGRRWSRDAFYQPSARARAQFPRCFSPQRRSTASSACLLTSVRCASRTCAYWPRGAPVPSIDPRPGFRPLEGNFLVNVWWVFSERFRATGARGVRPARELILTPVSSG